MRNFIFEFDQEVSLRLGLKLNEMLFLDYLLKFIDSGNMRLKLRDGKRYYRLTYKKVLEDLPILNVKERQLRNIISDLEKKGILERLSELKNEMHLYVNFDVLFGNKLPDGFDLSAIGFKDAGNGLLTIDYYDIKKIKIIHDNARVKELDEDNLFITLDANLKRFYGDTLYKGFIEDKFSIDEITDKHILISVSNIKTTGEKYGSRFKDAFDETIKELLDQPTPGAVKSLDESL